MRGEIEIHGANTTLSPAVYSELHSKRL